MAAKHGLLRLVLATAAVLYVSCCHGGTGSLPSLRQDAREEPWHGAAESVGARERDTGLCTAGDGGASPSSGNSGCDPSPNPTIVVFFGFACEELSKNGITVDDIFREEQPIGAAVYENYVASFTAKAAECQAILEDVFGAILTDPLKMGRRAEDTRAQPVDGPESGPQKPRDIDADMDRLGALISAVGEELASIQDKLLVVKSSIDRHFASAVENVASIVDPEGLGIFGIREDPSELIGAHGSEIASVDEIGPGMFLPACRGETRRYTTSDLVRPSLNFLLAFNFLNRRYESFRRSAMEILWKDVCVPTKRDDENRFYFISRSGESMELLPLNDMAQLRQSIGLGGSPVGEFMDILGLLRWSWEAPEQHSRAPQAAAGQQ